MSEPFLITGLPRSRTAWLAAAAMNDQSICHHEPLQYFERWEDLFIRIWGQAFRPAEADPAIGHVDVPSKRLSGGTPASTNAGSTDRLDADETPGGTAEDGARYIGVSDHALGFHLAAIMRRAAPRTLIVERPIAEVNASLARISSLPTSNFCVLLREALAFEHPNIMRVPFAALESSGVVKRCLKHLMPDAVISRARIEALQGLNIQTNVALALQIAAHRAGDVDALLGADVMARLRSDRAPFGRRA